MARWLRIHFCNAGEVSSIPSQGTQISYALQQLRQASQLLSLHTAAKTDTAKEIEINIKKKKGIEIIDSTCSTESMLEADQRKCFVY